MEFKTEKNKTTVFLYERITEGTAREFLQIVNNTKSTVLAVRINSPGGDVFFGTGNVYRCEKFPRNYTNVCRWCCGFGGFIFRAFRSVSIYGKKMQC